MEIQAIKVENLDLVCSICLDPSVDQETRDLMDEGMKDRICWIKKMIPKGLEILVALDKPRQHEIHYKWVGKMLHSDLAIHGQVPMGLLEFIPIEYALEPIAGKNSLFVNCMWILPPFWLTGVGEALLESFIEKAKEIGGASVVGYEGDKWFGTSINYMPTTFFEKFGFKEIDRDGSRVLLFLDLEARIKPKLISPNSEISSENSSTKLKIYFNSQCPWGKFMINIVKNKATKYPNLKVSIVNTDDRKKIETLGISRGISINGKPVIKRMASWNEIKTEIDKFQTEIH